MTEITREHLELAALAAGMTPVRMSDDGRGLLVAEQAEPWRPHTDIADAARLALRLNMEVNVEKMQISVVDDCWIGGRIVEYDGTQAGKERAFCGAVTLCAAEIGRRMREGGR